MRTSVVATALAALLLAGCGAGERKAAFDGYEKAMEPLLAAEAELRSRFDDKLEDAQAFGKEEGFVALVKDQMLPFYEEMSRTVAEYHPAERGLAEVHGFLVRYVELRLKLLRALRDRGRRAEAVVAATRGAREKVAVLVEEVGKAAEALNHAADASPAAAARLAPIFQKEGRSTQNLFAAIDALGQGLIPPDQFSDFLTRTVKPLYEGIAADLAAAAPGPDGGAMLLAGKAWAAAMQKVVAAGLEMAGAAAGVAPPPEPTLTNEQMTALWKEADEARGTYLTAAREYR